MLSRSSVRRALRLLPLLLLCIVAVGGAQAEEARLLRQPTLSDEHIAFAHAGDLWIVARDGGAARRLTSTPAVESDPHFSPDGDWLAFTSNRSGVPAVYVVPVAGGTPSRLTWYPSASYARGFSPDGSRVLYSSTRETAPVGYGRLWTVSREGGPSEMLPAPRGHRGWFAPDGKRIVVDPISRWDSEWRHYRGGQNTPLVILDLDDLDETLLPNERTTDIHPVWLGDTIYFLSDRGWSMNVWSWNTRTAELAQITKFDDVDVKWLAGRHGILVFERDGYLHTLDPANGRSRRLRIELRGDFPWAEPRWEDVGSRVRTAAISPTGKRAVFEARGEIFTVPVEKGDARNLTRSPGAADRAPVWSPKGDRIAWFSDPGDGYVLTIAGQDGLSEPRQIDIGRSRMAWESTWSPDGSRIAFVDDDVRVRVVDVESGKVVTADTGGVNTERGQMGLTWSPDSKWLAYAKTFPNQLRRIVAWSVEDDRVVPLTDAMADAVSPAWGRGGKHLYFLASTDLALGSGWANTSRMGADPSYGAYAIVLSAEGETPFALESDEEPEPKEETEGEDEDKEKKGKSGEKDGKEDEDEEKGDDAKGDKKKEGKDEEKEIEVRLDPEGIERRILALPLDVARYRFTVAGPEGSVFLGEAVPGARGVKLHKFDFEKREASVFVEGVSYVSVSNDGKKMLYRAGGGWSVVGTESKPDPSKGRLDLSLRMRVDRPVEWRQMFEEAWRYQRDLFYDPDHHGRDWDAVRRRYEPLVEHVRHRTDLNYVLDQMNGELSVGHSFVFGGDLPDVDSPSVGLLGADLAAVDGRWRIERIYTFESWNPGVTAPLDRPGLKVGEGQFLLAVDGVELTADDDPYRLLDGTAGRQTVLRINDRPTTDESWTVTVEPIGSESGLRQRAWVEDNRRRVDELSDGKLAYVWVPNTGQAGVISFNRYFFAQQDRPAAVIDERFNGGGLLDDYMVDLMTRKLRAAVTNEVPDGRPFRLPAGILGPKVLLINEFAGSGGDFFPWVFRQQQTGPLIGMRTWGGLVKSSVHYPLIDGGVLTAPDNAVFDPVSGKWIAENIGIAPDIEVRQDARTVAQGRDPQLERGVQEALRLLEEQAPPAVVPPTFSRPAKRP